MEADEVLDIIEIIKILCPRLQKMAAKTDNPFDDVIVSIICGLVQAK